MAADCYCCCFNLSLKAQVKKRGFLTMLKHTIQEKTNNQFSFSFKFQLIYLYVSVVFVYIFVYTFVYILDETSQNWFCIEENTSTEGETGCTH